MFVDRFIDWNGIMVTPFESQTRMRRDVRRVTIYIIEKFI
jgi:hypothetical protein